MKKMTPLGVVDYQIYLSELSEYGLDTETRIVIKQASDKATVTRNTAERMQHLINEYQRRKTPARFLEVYREVIS